MEVQLFQDALHVGAYGAGRDDQGGLDLARAVPAGRQRGDLPLTRRQRLPFGWRGVLQTG